MVGTGMKHFSIVLLCTVLVSGMALSQSQSGKDVFAAQEGALTDLEDLDQFRNLFDQQAGVPRLILLLSPT